MTYFIFIYHITIGIYPLLTLGHRRAGSHGTVIMITSGGVIQTPVTNSSAGETMTQILTLLSVFGELSLSFNSCNKYGVSSRFFFFF